MINSASGRKTASPIIDELSDNNKISAQFASKLCSLLSSGCSSDDRSDFLLFLNCSLSDSDISSAMIMPSNVAESISRLKLGKSDGTSLLSNHFICASSVLSEFLSSLFTAMLRHGFIPSSLRDCILHPIPKPGVKIHLVEITTGQLL